MIFCCWSWLSISIHYIHAGKPLDLLFFSSFLPPFSSCRSSRERCWSRSQGWRAGWPASQSTIFSPGCRCTSERVTYEKKCFLLCFTSIKAVSLYRLRISEINLKTWDDPFKKLLAGDWTNNLSITIYHVLILTNQINSRRALTAEPACKSDMEHKFFFIWEWPSVPFFVLLPVK